MGTKLYFYSAILLAITDQVRLCTIRIKAFGVIYKDLRLPPPLHQK
jgi:hypothetical protein